jgi:hypothetical protein
VATITDTKSPLRLFRWSVTYLTLLSGALTLDAFLAPPLGW